MRPDLAALTAYWQAALRLLDWRLKVAYVPDLANAAGAPVHGLCNRFVDAKRASIAIRDPETPAPSGSGPSVEEVLIHELLHLHFAPLAGNAPAEIAAEEQAVWSIAEALFGAKGSGKESQMARAMVAHAVSRRAASTQGKKGPTMDPKIVSAAIAAIKAGDGDSALAMLEKMLVAAAGGTAEPPEDEGASDGAAAAKTPADPPPAPADDKKQPPPPAAAAVEKEPMKDQPQARVMASDPTLIALAAQVQELTARAAARAAADLSTERATLASRAGLAPELVAIVKDAKTPIETARQIASVAKAPDAIPTRGEGQNGETRYARLPPSERAALDEQMGLAPRRAAIRNEGNKMIFGVMTPDEARKVLASKKEG